MISYTTDCTALHIDQLRGGFFAGWPNPPQPEAHLRILQGSSHVVLAREADGTVVGFITAISDGVSAAYIPHLEVLERLRGAGIGSELVRRMLAQLSDLYVVDLICDEDVQPFYERLGLRRYQGMIWRNYERQACD